MSFKTNCLIYLSLFLISIFVFANEEREITILCDLPLLCKEIQYIKKTIKIKTVNNLGIQKVKNEISEYVKSKGYPNNTVEIMNQGGLIFKVIFGRPYILKHIQVDINDDEIKRYVISSFKELHNNPWDKIEIKSRIEDIAKKLTQQGYLFLGIDTKASLLDNQKEQVGLKVKIKLGKKYFFQIKGNTLLGSKEFVSNIKKSIIKNKVDVDQKNLKSIVSDIYIQNNIFNTNTFVEKYSSGKDQIYFFINIKEGRKLKVVDFDFKGVSYFTKDKLLNLYNRNASVVASRMFYDKKYLEEFVNILGNEYLKNGFMFVQIEKPFIKEVDPKRKVLVEYYVTEGRQTIVKGINLNGLNKDLETKVLNRITNKINTPFNAFELQNDLKKVLVVLQNEGHFFAKIINSDKKNIIKYSNSYSSVVINLNIKKNDQILFGKTIIKGIVTTQPKVLNREVSLDKKEIITLEKLNRIKTKLKTLGLFSTVSVVPLKEKNQDGTTDLFIKVSEKDFGALEIAPGFRTDIGAKLSGGVEYNNLNGSNRFVSFKAQINYRMHNENLDAQRKEQDQQLLEHSEKLFFSEPYVFNFPLRFDFSISNSMKRFYSFDAQILKGEATIRKNLFEIIDTSLRYQFETISQYNSTDLKDKGNFKIGGITPGITLDFRNNRINPSKGSSFDFSYEIASPDFGSQKDKELQINFRKFVTRNRFYFPLGDNVLAVSFAYGVATNEGPGHIPSIKVFRLNGVDIVRGYADDEINKVQTDRDIHNEVIKKAYFTNLKIEPRFYLNDNTMLGVFFDAGRVYQDHIRPLHVRTSVGISLKFLTPVGSLNFEYGVKLSRKREGDGQLETPGRFHLSIGFF